MKSFEHFGLSENTLNALKKRGFEIPTPIQAETIQAILHGTKDIVGQAQTGTGKTAAFALPILELISENANKVQAIVLTPTRELAIQVSEEIYSLKGNKKVTITPIYGGQAITLQLRHLKKGVDIVVGTPGRVLDHLERGTLRLDSVSFVVLDEADEMMNMGFLEDVTKILDATAAKKRTLLFSATMPPAIMNIAKKYMGEYEVIKVTGQELTVSSTDQIYFEVTEADKFDALCRIIDIEEDFYGLVFCRTKIDADTIARHLVERGYDADALHGDLSQAQREKILDRFKRRLITVLVATDVAARGIDVQDLTHVINFALPQDPESYVHRIGRTGRAGKEGVAVTFITPAEYRKLQFIKREAQTDIRRGTLPKVKDVINTKKTRIRTYLEEIISENILKEYRKLSQELLFDNNPEDMLAALLQFTFKGELEEKNYTEIEDAKVEAKGKTRLFVGQGKRDGLTRKKLMDIIKDKCRIPSGKINEVQILDRCSFISLPFPEAEKVLSFFKSGRQKSGLYITRAKK